MYKSRTHISLLEDEELYSEKELRRLKRTRRYWSERQDEKLRIEQEYARTNVCPKCHLKLTTTGKCPRSGCDYQK